MRCSRWFAIALSVSLSTCTGHKAKSSIKIVRYTFGDDVKSADPAQANDVYSTELMGNIFEGLLTFSYSGAPNNVEPLIAEKLPVTSNKGHTVTFKLRAGVKFQDDPSFAAGKGREVTAEDFVYSFKRLSDPRVSSPNSWMFDELVEGLADWRQALEKAPADERDTAFARPIKGFSAPDTRTLVIRLTRPYPQLPFILAMPQTSVVAHEVVEHYGPEIGSHPVGTGPFHLKSWIRGSKIIVERNPAAREQPKVQEVHWDIITQEQPAWLKFRTGELDRIRIPKDNFLEAVDPTGNLKPELAKEGIVLHKTMTLTSWWIEFNMKDPLLGQNAKLRQALALAFNRARALELLHNNSGILANSPIAPSLEGGSDLPPYPYEYNVERAKQLLAEAGYPQGKGLPELTFDLRGPGLTQRQLGDLLRDNFSKIGVRLAILANSYPEALEKGKTGHFQIMLGGWMADYPDPESFLQVFYSGNASPGPNSSNFQNKEYDALYQQMRTQSPGPARVKAIKKMVEILQRQVPAAFFYHAVDYDLSWKWLKNYKPQLFQFATGKYVDVEH